MTNDELTAIYNEANGLDPKRHNPITTERIFAAMRAAAEMEREAAMAAIIDGCPNDGSDAEIILRRAWDRVRTMRSNANVTGLAPAQETTK